MYFFTLVPNQINQIKNFISLRISKRQHQLMLISSKVKQKQIEKNDKGNKNKVVLYIMYKFKIT